MGLLERLSIKMRLQINALVVAIAMLVMLFVIIFQSQTMQSLNAITSITGTLNAKELGMRKDEKDFLAYKQQTSLDKFEKKYKEMQQGVTTLKVYYEDLNVDQNKLLKFESLAKQYKKDFDHVVSLQREIGLHPKDALYGELRAAVHSVEELLHEYETYQLLADMLQLRRNEKDFMLRSDLKYLAKFEKNIIQLEQDVSSSDLSEQVKSDIKSMLVIYQNKFTQLVNKSEELGLSMELGALGKMRKSIKSTDEMFEKMLNEAKEMTSSTSASAKITAFTVFGISLLIVMSLVYLTSRSIIVPINEVCETIHKIRGRNDLSLSIVEKGQDEVSAMTHDFNGLICDFKTLIFEVNSALSTLNAATEDLAETTSATSDGMQDQLHEADMVATAATQMQATIQDISHNTEAAANKAESTNVSALEGRSEVDSTVARISELSTSLGGASEVVSQLEKDGETIGSVLDVIRGIAEQTNLLALNAAIEAARAGEQGRGFAVVADEVRSLAQRTQESTQEIESIISTLQQRTQQVVSLMQQCRQQGDASSAQATKAGELLQSITEDVQNIMDMSTQIATAIDEQNLVASEVNKNVVKIRDIAEQATEHASKNAHTSEEVSEQARVLHGAIAKFKV
ncbi:methyl-accepting chemotaxis protein [Pseudoalteromonas sp. C2R02]|uniref:methyl-accepting chemotaxis protein n=1 Tax=Pseudoalteromonas sp. C2R02 TaxID=2841565 RepID=UPI001C09D54F|nr:methyl-accepting chemotaxis protein [Pseudoalteromonas sp. C2R02]MBU2972605.1 methyl-accepting chemotaxis protein [Pseudoalteromonas sp. C2R02]